jgi:hypothetical protein
LAAHGVGITVGRTSLEAVVRSVSTNTLRAAAAIDSQSDHDVKKCQQIFNSPIISARAVFAGQRTTTALQQRATRVGRFVKGDTSRRFSNILDILVVLVQTLGRVLGELEFDGVWWSLGRILMSWAQGDLLCPFRCLGYPE